MTHQDVGEAPSVRDWFDAFDAESARQPAREWELRRLERLHGVQVSLDVIAHAHNIPLRLLRLDNLKHLDATLASFVRKYEHEVLELMTEPRLDGNPRIPPLLSVADAKKLIAQLQEHRHAAALRDWVLALSLPLCSESDQKLPDLPEGYAEWFLMLLPHLERDIWLTDMSNPLPVHNLARMVEHWALFVLMWAWSRADELEELLQKQTSDKPTVMPAALSVEHLGLIVLPAYQRRGRKRPELTVALLVGPFVRAGAAQSDDSGEWFCKPFNRFLSRIARANDVSGWDGVHEKAPDRSELADALESRAGIEDDEAQRRASHSRLALLTLLDARLAPDLFVWPNKRSDRPLSRANWETMAVLASWQSRWGSLLHDLTTTDGRPLWVELPRHRVKMLVPRMGRLAPGQAPSKAALVFTASDRKALEEVEKFSRLEVNDAIEMARLASEAKWVETPGNLHARVRERLQAGWYAYISAINHLLARHTRSDRSEGADAPDWEESSEPHCEEVDHLLRGFGGRICRYLIGMARADLAEIYWLDYSTDPPRLRHAGSAERLVQHRAARQKIWKESGSELARSLAGSRDPLTESDFLAVRATFGGQIVPLPQERKASFAQDRTGDTRARFDFYDFGVKPQDGIAVPLTFNGRVVGVLALAGVASNRHFDTRLYPSLRILAQDLGLAMYFHNQVWQMRRINWLASNVQLELWQEQDLRKPQHPMTSVAQCLANIFLCPGVHIWLRDSRSIDERYLLSGSTALDAFESEGGLPEHAPSVTLPAIPPGSLAPLTRPTFAFAADPWLPLAGAGANDSQVQALRGRFIQARIDKFARTTRYDYETAARGDLLLGVDFLNSLNESKTLGTSLEALPHLRDALYEKRKWTDLMAFALVNESGGHVRPIGIVSLHGPSQKHPDSSSPWPPGWRPVVSHVQTYVPYVLAQTEMIAKPLNQLVQYLLHQGRNELNAVAVRATTTKHQLQRLLAANDPPGKVRPWVRRRLNSTASIEDPDLQRQLFQLDQLLLETAEGLEAQTRVEHAESLTMLSRLIERRRSVAALGHDLAGAGDVHRAQWIDLNESIRKALAEYSGDLKAQHIYWSTKIPENCRLLTQPRLWAWLLSDLAHNIAKYAVSTAEVSLQEAAVDGRRGYKIRFMNEAEYDPALDTPELLVRFGVQGSAGRNRKHRITARSKLSRIGTGIGLWGVNELACTLGMTLEVDIKPLEKPSNQARYHFDLVLPSDLLRRDSSA